MRGVRKRRAPGRVAFKRKVRQRQLARRARTAKFNGELKFHDLDIDDATIAQGASIAQASCNLIAQGVTEITRVGRKCTIRSILWRFRVALPSTATANETADSIRVILYQDKQTNGATAATTDILKTADFQSFRNLGNVGRFVILMDRVYDLNAPSGSGRGSTDTLSYGQHNIQDTLFKKVNIPIEFSAGTGAITEIRTNNIGLMLLASDGHAGFGSKMRLRFSDT